MYVTASVENYRSILFMTRFMTCIKSEYFQESNLLSSFTVLASVARLGDFLHFGQPLKAGGNNYFTQSTHIVRQFL